MDVEINGYIWDPEVTGVRPASAKELLAEYKRLEGIQTELSSEPLIEFGRRVSARVVADEPDNQDRLDYLGNLEKEARRPQFVMSLTIPYDPDEDYLWIADVIAEEARSLGLCVFIPSLVSFLPDGTLVPPASKTQWDRDVADVKARRQVPVVGFPQRKAGIGAWVRPRMIELAQSFGYSREYRTEGCATFFSKHLNDSDIDFSYGLSTWDGEKLISASVAIRIPVLRDIMLDSGFSGRPDEFHRVIIDSSYHNMRFDFTKVTSEDSFNKFREHAIEDILTAADSASTISNLDKLLNGSENSKRSRYMQIYSATPYALIIAWLNCNPDFERLAKYLPDVTRRTAGAGGGFSKAIMSPKWQQLVQYLRDNVKPLV